ncbi:MAG: class Ib ribonucleoside-diphosphate reductase assembly flavoprotein NrdI [Bacillota bacterium]
MLIVYATRTGNTRRFLSKTGFRTQPIEVGDVTEPFILATYTDGEGEVPERVWRFLETNSEQLRGVAAGGSRNFGQWFGRAADEIAAEYDVPVIHRFELSGTPSDVETFKKGVGTLVKL